MATFNKSTKNSNIVTNNEGHAAYAYDQKTRLATEVMTSFMNEPKFYGDNTATLIADAIEVAKTDPEFVAKLVGYTRNVCNMRSTSHALVAVLAATVKGEPFVRRTIKSAVVRGDDVTNILATYMALFGNPIPNSLRRGLKDAIENLDNHGIAKYTAKNHSVTMADAIKICHPAASNPARKALYHQVIDGTVKVPTSWRTETYDLGNTAEAWNKLMAEGNLPYMAALRNINNVAKTGGDIRALADIIGNRDHARASRQLPFRFLSAYDTARRLYDIPEDDAKYLLAALENAFAATYDNLDRLPGTTVIAIDTSGSMTYNTVSEKSSMTIAKIAATLGICLQAISDDAHVIAFDSNARYLHVEADEKPLDFVYSMRFPGGSTNMASVFELIEKLDIDADRIIILSDNEVNGYSWYRNSRNKDMIQRKLTKYRVRVGHDVWCHAWDLQGYGTTQFAGPFVNILTGWSERGLALIAMAERGEASLIADVEAMPLP